MAPIAIGIGLALIVLTLPAPASAEATGSRTFTPNPQVDRIFAPWNDHTPGCALSVKKDGSIVYQRGFGMADLEQNFRIDPGKTVFHAASLAKQFTAMSIMLLVGHSLGQPRLSLSNDAYEHTPLPNSIRCPVEHTSAAAPGIRCPITISDMLHHVSGLRDQWMLLELAGWHLSDDVIRQEDVLNLVTRMRTLNFKPRKGFSYSNTNYTLAGMIVEKVSGDTLPVFMNKHVFTPLGMENTKIIKNHGEIVENRATGYRRTHSGFEISMPNYDVVGPTNLLTTVEDLMRWDDNFDSKIVGGGDALRAMQTPLDSSEGYGLGLSISSENNRRIVEHDGRDAGFMSHLIRYPEQKLTVALLCNVALPETTPTRLLVRKVAAIYLRDPAPPDEEELHISDPTGRRFNPDDFVGRYHNEEIDATYEIKRIGSSLQVTRPRYEPRILIADDTVGDVFKIRNFSHLLTLVTLQFSRDNEKITGFQMFDDSPNPIGPNGPKDPNHLNNFRFIKVR